mmetsp:Transcript_4558/g.5275  ORF Transcript_4558/g.5275 Transcript_4558/m.5275 type:complete len:100 (-) Transcript_4558:25-324(-)
MLKTRFLPIHIGFLVTFLTGAILGAVWIQMFPSRLSWKGALGAIDCDCEYCAFANETVVVAVQERMSTEIADIRREKEEEEKESKLIYGLMHPCMYIIE